MRAVVIGETGKVQVHEVVPRSPDPGEVVVRMECAALCGSDLHGIDLGYPPHGRSGLPGAPGHEGVGLIEESRCRSRPVGMRVLTVPDRSFAGCFAEVLVLPGRLTLPVPTNVEPEIMILAQQLGTVRYALSRFVTRPPRSAAVIGLGPAGVHFVRCIKQFVDTRVVGVDPVGSRREDGQRAGANEVVDPRDPSALSVVQAEWGGVELVIEAAGRNEARRTAITWVKPKGVLGFFGLPEPTDELCMDYRVLFERQPTIRVSDGAQHEVGLRSFRRAIEEVAAHHSALANDVSHVLDLAEFSGAIELARKRDGVRKVVLRCT